MVIFYITQDTQRHPILPELKSGFCYFPCSCSSIIQILKQGMISIFFIVTFISDQMMWSFTIIAFEFLYGDFINPLWLDVWLNRWLSYHRKNIHAMFNAWTSQWRTNSGSICASHLFYWHSLTSCRVSSSWGKNHHWNFFDTDYTGAILLTHCNCLFIWYI